MNRNLLILRSVALLVIDGLTAFIASSKDGSVRNTRQNIRNESINNSYFQNLIATGMTTLKDLDTIAEIRPHEGGFIGSSNEAISFDEVRAWTLAAARGSGQWAADRGGGSFDQLTVGK